jgi:accessory gene regulator protein AgrB
MCQSMCSCYVQHIQMIKLRKYIFINIRINFIRIFMYTYMAAAFKENDIFVKEK